MIRRTVARWLRSIAARLDTPRPVVVIVGEPFAAQPRYRPIAPAPKDIN